MISYYPEDELWLLENFKFRVIEKNSPIRDDVKSE